MTTIAIDYSPAYAQTGGIGRYTRELTHALARLDADSDYRLFVAGAAAAALPRAPGANFRWRSTRLSDRWLARIWQRARIPLPVETFVGVVDLYHATDFVLPPTRRQTRTLLTVHDLSFVRVPEAASPALRAYLNAAVPASIARADHILADSQATKDDICALYHTTERKISVLYSGVDARFKPLDAPQTLATLEKYALSQKRYLLSVGTVQPRKNYSRVIQALAQLRAGGSDLHYAIAGGKGWLEAEMQRTIARTQMSDSVHLLGFVADADLPALYNGARALLLPSLYEGFGLPILEAMACGIPVITSSISSLPEVAGDAAILVDPYAVDAIADAIASLENDGDLRARLIAAGYQRAAHFTWQRAARQLKGIYARLLDS